MKTDLQGQYFHMVWSPRRLFVAAFFAFLTAAPGIAWATAPTTINPDIFSFQDTSPKVDGNTGALTQHITLDVPPGRNGLQPNISLDYNSQNTQEDSLFGYGWSLSIPYIERLNKTGTQDIYGPNAYFLSSLDGELALIGSTTLATTSAMASSTADLWVLIVGGGAGGGDSGNGGGGGAGGFYENAHLTATSSTYSIVVGASAAGRTNGNNSSAFGITMTGGGKGGRACGYASGSNGGSGGGQANGSGGAPGTGTTGQGYDGGGASGSCSNSQGGGGGGGASQAGSAGNGSVGGKGGDGTASTISGTSVTYAAGGGAERYDGGSGAGGSSGVGGAGCNGSCTGGNATVSTGSGGGAGLNGGGTGAAGLVIVRYPTADVSNYTCGGSTTTSGSDTICTFTSNGNFTVLDSSVPTTTTVVVTTLYAPRIDTSGAHSYVYSTSTDSWIMYDKNGTQYFFGTTSQAKQSATTTSSNVSRWMLEKVVDTNGNYVSYTYAKDGNQIYPSQITYTGHNTTDGPMAVSFATTTRADVVDSYKSGYLVHTKYLISQITAAVNGTTVRQYDLSYTTGNNKNRSLLSSLRKNGWDENNTEVSLPATTFEYMSSTTAFVQKVGSDSYCGNPWAAADINGDGINEQSAMFWNANTGTWQAQISTYEFINSTTVTSPTNLMWAWREANTCPNETGTRLMDMNGDGRADAVYGNWNYTSSSGTTGLYIIATSSYSWTASSTGSSVVPYIAWDGSGSIHGLTTGLFGDINGSGLPSFVQRVDSQSISAAAYIANGVAWSAATSTIFSPPESMPSAPPDCIENQLVDVNGDGLADWIYTDGSSHTYVHINTGTGWNSTVDSSWTIATSTVYSSGGNCYDRGMRFADVNGDGLPDLVRGYYMPSTGPWPEKGNFQYANLNTGHGFSATSSAYAIPYVIQGNDSPDTNVKYNNLTNFDGNGQQNQDVLTTIANPKGGTAAVTYGYTTSLGRNTQLPYNLLVVTNLVNRDGRGGSESTTHAYYDGKQYLPSYIFNRKFAGFASTTETNANGTTVTYYSQGATSTAIGDQADGFPQVNFPFRKDVLTPGGTLVQKTFYRYDPYWHGNSVFVGLGRQLEENFASDGTHRDKAAEYTYSTSTNDLLQVSDYGEVTGSTDGTYSDISGDSRTTFYSYAASSSVNMSVPIEKRVVDNSSATSTDSKYYYDGLAFGQVNIGNQTKQENWISGSAYASSTKTYNSYGLVATSTDRNGNATAYSYDAYNLYPATTTNALSQSTAYTYNYSNGKIKKTTDPNGAITQSLYDGIGRIAEVDQSDLATPASLVTKSIIAYTDSTTTPSLVHQSDYLNSATTTDTYDYYDGLGRLVQKRTSSEYTSTSTVTDLNYDSAGTPGSQSLPYFSLGTSNTSSSSVASLYTRYAYDALGRVLTAANAVGTTSNAYSKWTTTTTDPKGNIKDTLLDAYGNLAQVVEHGPSIATTTYTYDVANNLTKITDAVANVRNFTYDGLGRLLTAEDLHAVGDATFGSWSYSYDNAGNRTAQTDPKSQTVTRTYDALNRMLVESLTGSGAKVTNTYDSCRYGIGRICTASSTDAISASSYDVLGRVSNATTTVSGIAYATAYDYDRQGNLTSLTNVNGNKINYVYNTAGLVSLVSRTASSATSAIANLSAYAPTRQLGQIIFGSGATTTYTYDAAALYRLTNILSTGIATTTAVDPNLWVLIVGGGAGGGQDGNGGGGGAGGFYENTGLTTSVGTYDVVVGSSTAGRTNGKTSSAFGITMTGGGTGGRACPSASGSNGGSGGGQANGTGGSPGTGIAGQGHNGGSASGSCSNSEGAGGGGGASQAGGVGDGSVGGKGGDGIASTISGTSVAYAAGGGGERYNGGSGAGGSSGVGGAGCNGACVGGNAASSTGSGGGAGLEGGGTGAAGIVIIRYPTAQAASYACGGATTTSASDTICTFTSSGTFTVSNTSSTTTVLAKLQDLSYAYDADGNITSRTDSSDWAHSQQVAYTYDSLNRIASASTTSGTVTSYNQTFTYDALGNLQAGPFGAYSYQGGSGSSYANPDAATQVVLTTDASSPTIAYDGSTLAGNGTPASSLTFSHTTGSGTSGLIIVTVAEATTSPSCTGDAVTGVAYNGVGLTDLNYYVRETTNVKGALKTYYGFAPASGAHNVVVSASGSCILYAVAATYSGVKQSGMPDASGSGNPLSDSGAVSVFQATTTANYNAWGVLVGYPNAAGTATAGSNTTIRQQQAGNLYYADSNAPISPAGTIGLNWSTASATHWLANYFSIPPTVSTPGSTATTTYAYDNNGNLTWATAGATSTNYVYDYANRLTHLLVGAGGATTTTTYGYDAGGNRVSQATGNISTVYANRYYSVVSDTSAASTTATSTEYIFNGDTLLATIDRPMIDGVATGTAVVRYNHTDNLGSTNATSDERGDLAQWFDYAPYGAVVESTNTGTTTAARQYIGQFTDTTGLSYLNARYYNPNQGQFLSEDPVFWEVGQTKDGKAALLNPQSQNSYSYAEGNPIIKKDTDGRFIPQAMALGALYGGISGVALQAYSDYQTGSPINVGTYASSFGKGATVGAAAVYGAIPAAVASIGYSLTSNYFGGGITADNTINAFTEGAVTGLTAGFLKGLPRVPGPQASKVFGGYYFGGVHGVRYAQQAAFDLNTGIYFGNVQGITNQFLQPNFSNQQSSGSLSSSQSAAISGVVGAFTPSNSQQAAAVQRVVSAFSQKRRRKNYDQANDEEVDSSEPRKKYTTDWRGTVVIFAALAALNATIFYWNRNPEMSLSKVVIGLMAWFAFIGLGVLLVTIYSYASISGTTLKFVWLLFSRRIIDINSITDINDQSTHKVAKSRFRSLYIFYNEKDGSKKWIEFRITIFPEKTLGKLIKDLKQINPHIELNAYSRKLMESAT